jgi:hypothetical protein
VSNLLTHLPLHRVGDVARKRLQQRQHVVNCTGVLLPPERRIGRRINDVDVEREHVAAPPELPREHTPGTGGAWADDGMLGRPFRQHRLDRIGKR